MFWDVFLVLCANAGKSPNSVCKELGFSNATATHWKNGQQPRTSTLSKISDYFGVSTTYLLSGVDEQKKTAPVEQPSDTKIEQLMNDVSGLSESDLDKLLDYVELLKLKQNQ